jgi:hypothetical protein
MVLLVFLDMIIGNLILSVIVLVIAMWVIMKLTKFRHKILAIFLIGLVLLGYFSFNLALGEQEVDYTTAKGVGQAFGIYFSWLGTIVGNAQTITSNAVKNNSDNDMGGK